VFGNREDLKVFIRKLIIDVSSDVISFGKQSKEDEALYSDKGTFSRENCINRKRRPFLNQLIDKLFNTDGKESEEVILGTLPSTIHNKVKGTLTDISKKASGDDISIAAIFKDQFDFSKLWPHQNGKDRFQKEHPKPKDEDDVVEKEHPVKTKGGSVRPEDVPCPAGILEEVENTNNKNALPKGQPKPTDSADGATVLSNGKELQRSCLQSDGCSVDDPSTADKDNDDMDGTEKNPGGEEDKA